MKNPFPDLMKRKLVQWTTGYAAAGVVVVEALQMVGGQFGWPEWVLETGIILVAFGLPTTAVIAWFHGERGRQQVGALESALLLIIALGAGTTIWLVRGEEEPGPVAAASAPPLAGELLGPPEPNSARVAVLPFDNLSALGDQDAYLADGLHDEIITQISKVRALEVVSRTSVLRYRDPQGKTAREIGEELGVWYLVEGSLRRIGDQIRVTAQLIDTRKDGHLWAETYDGEPSAAKLFQLQSDVALQVAAALQATLHPSELTRIQQIYTVNDEAYRSYLQGLRALKGAASMNIPRALEFFRRAVELDPDFAPAWESLAVVYTTMGNYFLAPGEEAFPLAAEASERALILDPNLTDARVMQAWVQFCFFRNYEATEAILAEVMQRNPNSFNARYLRAFYLEAMGRLEESVREAEILTRLDPTAGNAHRIAARMLHMARRFDDAERVLRWAMTLTPEAVGAHLYLALTLEQLGRFEEARDAMGRWAIENGRTPEAVGVMEERFAGEGMAGVWRSWLEWRLSEASPRPGVVALGYARLGDVENAVLWLNRAVDEFDSWSFQLNDPAWDPVRGSDGFSDLLDRLGFPALTGRESKPGYIPSP